MSMQQQNNEEISASLFGQSVAAKGTSAIIMLVLVAALGSTLYLLYDGSREDRQALVSISEVLNKHSVSMENDHKLLLKTTENLAEAGSSTTRQLKIQNYIILSDPSEKVEIKRKLGRPAELQ